MKAAVLAFGSLVAGCELIADIPNPSQITMGDGGVGSDGSTGDPDAPVDAKVGCDLDSECPSGVCLANRMCAMDSQILVASPTGTGNCIAADPCTVDLAVTKLDVGKDVIKLLPGVYERSTQIEITKPVTFAGTGATWHGNQTQSFLTHLTLTAGTLTIIGIDFDLNGTIAATCSAGELTLSRTNVHGGFAAMYASGSCLTKIDRSRVTGNTFYAASFSAGTSVEITNSFITDNSASFTNAVLLFDQVTGTIRNTTISNNTPAAMSCTSSPALVMTSLIAYGNASVSGLPSCTINYSVLDPGYSGPGTNNISMDPLFIGGMNYHLQATSPVRGKGDPVSTMIYDVDGETRPQPAGSYVDPGADEVP